MDTGNIPVVAHRTSADITEIVPEVPGVGAFVLDAITDSVVSYEVEVPTWNTSYGRPGAQLKVRSQVLVLSFSEMPYTTCRTVRGNNHSGMFVASTMEPGFTAAAAGINARFRFKFTVRDGNRGSFQVPMCTSHRAQLNAKYPVSTLRVTPVE
jgi:hypothetical protein